jgi:two-component system, NtrC family, nitrogen regulation sensor histidine kinase GlnL
VLGPRAPPVRAPCGPAVWREPAVAAEYAAPSALAHFDPADLLDALATGILMLDAQLCPVYANVAAQDLLAFSLKMARGRPFTELLHEPEVLGAILRRSLASGETIADRELTVRPAGSPREPRTLDVTLTPLDGVTGRHLLLELADTTQRQRISRENDLLARLDSSRLMVRQLAHEIKNPLGGLRGAAQLLERELPAAALKEYTRVIIGEADRLTALVDSMARPSQTPSRTALNVHEICEHVYHLLRAEAPATLTIERDYDPSLPNAHLDRHQMIQALLNVARNALQAQGDKGRIVLRTRARSNVSIGSVVHRLTASVQVEDTGPGVPEHLRSSIFYPLVTGRANGTGLGLAVAQELVTRNGGIIEFESEFGRTVFTLLLPLGDDT